MSMLDFDPCCVERILSSSSLRSDSVTQYVPEHKPADFAAAFCQRVPALVSELGCCITAAPLSGGLNNDVFLVSGSKSKVALKIFEAFNLTKGPSLPISLARLCSEAAAITIAHSLAPKACPHLVHADLSAQVLGTRFLEAKESLATALVSGRTYPGMGEQLGDLFARLAHGTLPATLGRHQHQQLSALLAESADCKAAMETVVFDAFEADSPYNCWPAALEADVAALIHNNQLVKVEVEGLRQLFLAPPPERQVLVHSDAWLGNILCGQADNAIHVIDWEFACMGPEAYDIGHTMGQLLLGLNAVLVCLDTEEQADNSSCRPQQVAWLLACMETAWTSYFATRSDLVGAALSQQQQEELLADALGFAALTLLRWSIGRFNMHEALELRADKDGPAGVAATRRAVHLAYVLLLDRKGLGSIQMAVGLIKSVLAWDEGDYAAATQAAVIQERLLELLPGGP